MSKQTIERGRVENDGTGDSLRTAAQKINANFTELYDGVRRTITGTTGTLASTDNGTLIVCTNAGGCAITVPASLGATFRCEILAAGGDSVFLLEGGSFVRSVYGGTEIPVNGKASLTAASATTLYLNGDVEIPAS